MNLLTYLYKYFFLRNKLENKCESHYITFEKSFGQVPEGSEDISNQLKGTKQVNIDSDIVIEQEM